MRCRHEPIDRNCPRSCIGPSPCSRRISRAASAFGASDPLSWKLDVLRVKRSRDLTQTTGLGIKKRQERSHTWHANQASSLGRMFRARDLTSRPPCSCSGLQARTAPSCFPRPREAVRRAPPAPGIHYKLYISRERVPPASHWLRENPAGVVRTITTCSAPQCCGPCHGRGKYPRSHGSPSASPCRVHSPPGCRAHCSC